MAGAPGLGFSLTVSFHRSAVLATNRATRAMRGGEFIYFQRCCRIVVQDRSRRGLPIRGALICGTSVNRGPVLRSTSVWCRAYLAAAFALLMIACQPVFAEEKEKT